MLVAFCSASVSLPLLLVLLLGALESSAQKCRLVPKQQIQLGTVPQAPLSGGDSGNTTGTSSASPSPTSSESSSASATPSLAPFNYGKDTVRGVNLGGWFVLEPWITPSIFENTNNSDIVDEYTFGQMLDSGYALDVLQNHWDTWITEDDFIAINAAGLNHVRMQLGYWSVPITSEYTNYTTSVSPYIAGAWPYLLRALGWAKKHSVHVILDLHGAPGSQNGYDNSGRRGSANWAQGTNVNRTIDIIRFVAGQIGGMIDVLELLNEPAGYQSDIHGIIADYWQAAYQAVREVAGTSLKVMIGDAFLGVDNWDGFMTSPDAQGVLMDYHQYQVFNYNQLAMSYDEHIADSCQVLSTLQSYAKSNLYTISGEWSNAITDCTKWLNGRGVGARWDGTWQPGQQVFGSCDGYTGNSSAWSDDYKTFLRKYWESQVAIGEAVQGWVFWTWKAENSDDWSYQKGLEGGWIPQDPTDLIYPDICS
ncbi:glycoside hydrolase family 5 protein [Trametes coccinea BRFM310]|uniref:Glycoside hydrolase family 5 protein n=1 Tax=Trametes coccinea (strain BRFM310) TaxID=1353009 RepID=A0A1Y2IZP3_TRAC3|nr:glycoside hydrolase family 5 protein [Trametes coccinea BRFM310]